MVKKSFYSKPTTYEDFKKGFFIQVMFCGSLLLIFIVAAISFGHFYPFGIVGLLVLAACIALIPLELRIYKKKYEVKK